MRGKKFFSKYRIYPPAAQACLAFIVAVAILFFQMGNLWEEVPYADSVTYMSVAVPLYEAGVYSDGTFTGTNELEAPGGRGMFFAPLYPAFLAGLMALDRDLYQSMKCSVEYRRPVVITEKCEPLNLKIMVVVQIFLMALAAMLVWMLAYIITGHLGVSWLAFFFIFPGMDYAELAAIAMVESILLPLFTFVSIALVLAWQRQSLKWAFLCGGAFGLLVLTKPSFLYLLYVFLPFVVIWAGWRYYKSRTYKPALMICAFLFVSSLIIMPWVIRNGTKLGVWDVTYGLAPFTFAQRAAFNDMSWTEWVASFVYGLPSVGDSLSERFLPEETWRRHDYGNPEGFYQQGNHVLRPRTLEEAGGYDKHLSYLFEHYMLNDPLKHVMVTFSMVWRGMWVGSKPGLIALPAFALFLLLAAFHRRWSYVIVGIPPLFMLGLHGFTSVNITRYNLIMLPAMGIAFGWALLWVYRRIKKHRIALPGLEKKA